MTLPLLVVARFISDLIPICYMLPVVYLTYLD